MKIFATITSLLLTSVVFCQNSYYFSQPLPSAQAKVTAVDAKWFGKYKDEATSLTYEFSEEGINVISTKVSTIDKKTVRESSKYRVKDNYLFGVVLNDSVPCVLEKGVYYFGIRNQDNLVFAGSKTILTKVSSDVYILNFPEDGSFSPVKIEFKNGQLTLSDFDYDPTSKPFTFISNQAEVKSNGQNLVVLSPTMEEFSQLDTPIHFVQSLTFVRLEE